MKNLVILVITLQLFSCVNSSHTKEFDTNTALAKAYFQLHEEENAEAMFEFLHPDMQWHLPGYGSEMGNIQDIKNAILGYHNEFEDIKFTADYWLPGVDTETGVPDGSTRVYGTWNAIHSNTGKKVTLTAYHSFEFKDGKIFNGGDWFDLGGMMNSFLNHNQEIINVVHMTSNVSEAEVEAFSTMYQNTVNNLEPTSLSFRFTRTGENTVTLIERYKNSEAVLLHIKNVSPGGLIDEDFEMFQKVFTIQNMTLYGDVSESLREAIEPFQIPTTYVPVIAGYSR
jgi:ketosteroid isomerase-like protein